MNIKRQFKRKELKRYRKVNGIKKRRPSTGSVRGTSSASQTNKPWAEPLIIGKQSWD